MVNVKVGILSVFQVLFMRTLYLLISNHFYISKLASRELLTFFHILLFDLPIGMYGNGVFTGTYTTTTRTTSRGAIPEVVNKLKV